ncbi:imm11 family protein [Flavobacterium humi]|uniref:Immunity MXAN-0049 protein domain-containing protein n=1 Tax=Flavobacterium humi TaxID=2562683 RepID=A0A4Z0LAD8_9FLAO|nr:DUF1629 domain-containing protein [Flavobacterium humi]TGD58260.1 hypothetical protein E4635_09660 [Flavobacterium humi]
MNFYSINNSLDNKIVGDYNQVINAVHNCDIWENPKFIDRIDFVKIDFEPITSNAILEKKAKLTDLINASCVGFSLKLLTSDKLMHILEKYSHGKCQFFESPVIYKNEKIQKYWIIHPYAFNMGFIDFDKSTISARIQKEGGGTERKTLEINSLDDFMNSLNFYKEKGGIITINNVYLNNDIEDDFFILSNVEGGIKYIVSEKLKKEIEDANCTGIEFQPVGLSINEWLGKNGEREKIYGKI